MNKKKTDKRKEKALEELRKSLTEPELNRIKEQRRFENVEEGTKGYEILLYLDEAKKLLRQKKLKIRKRLWNIDRLKNHRDRLQEQLDSGEITEKLDDNTTMNEEEVKTEIMHQEWTIEGEINDIVNLLGEIRTIVGMKDLKKNEIMTEDEYEKYAKEIEEEVKERGYKLLG